MKKNEKMKKGAPHSHPQLRGLRYKSILLDLLHEENEPTASICRPW